jgi:hypothetical protein
MKDSFQKYEPEDLANLQALHGRDRSHMAPVVSNIICRRGSDDSIVNQAMLSEPLLFQIWLEPAAGFVVGSPAANNPPEGESHKAPCG